MELLIQRTDKVGVSKATTEDVKAWLADQGLVAVPLEPTEAMIEAGNAVGEIEGGCVDITDELPAIYKAMIASQPSPS